jgi:hypothetical protein
MRVPWLADVLRRSGLTVIETSGWHGRGRELVQIKGVVCHHTATPPSASDDSIAKMLINGRPDLNGPLAQLGLDRQGRYWVVADGRANHNGYGAWGNDSLGIEAFNSGLGEPWSTPQLTAYAKGAAALCRAVGLRESQVQAHREQDPKRKIDPTGIDMNTLRSQVKRYLDGEEEDDMPSEDFFKAQTHEVVVALGKLQEEVARREGTQSDVLRDIRDALQAIRDKPSSG